MNAHEPLEGLLKTTNLLPDGPGKRFAKRIKDMVNESAVLSVPQWEEVKIRIITFSKVLDDFAITQAEFDQSMAIATFINSCR
jgi:hypothetical protein